MDDEKKQLKSNRRTAVLLYGFLFGYVLSFVFSGNVYTAVADTFNHSVDYSIQAMISHMIGLIFASVFVTKWKKSVKTMKLSIFLCILFTPFFSINNNVFAIVIYGAVAFFSGVAVACWGGYYKNYIKSDERFRAMSETLVLANVLMIISDSVATNFSSVAGFIIVIMYLVCALVILVLDKRGNTESVMVVCNDRKQYKSLILLFCFIVIITITSGLMYGVVNTEYESFEFLTNVYWAVPYIITLLILRSLSNGRGGTVSLYIAMVFISIGFILNCYLKKTSLSYIIIDTFLLSAAGILDLFWSSIVGKTFEHLKNPVRVLAIGWSANVMGVIIGNVISVKIIKENLSRYSVTIIALAVVVSALILLPYLLESLRETLIKNYYLNYYLEMTDEKKKEVIDIHTPTEKLTLREKDVLELLLMGKTNNIIAKELNISENTVKTHVRNILGKYGVENRVKLLSVLLK